MSSELIASKEIDIVIRGGMLVDGTGSARRMGDLAIAGDFIVAVGGNISASDAKVIDARGAIVTPGWIDVHTHLDGQVSWDDTLDPSFSNGVTTLVMGNCGVGFAPCIKGHEQALINMMEGVEDIPGTALAEGIPWGSWESFEEYLDFLDNRAHSMDLVTQLPHSALRLYVMGERALNHEQASPEDIVRMRDLAESAARAGAAGISTSRTVFHRSINGTPIPGTFASIEELIALAEGAAAGGASVFQAIPASSAGEMAVYGGEQFTIDQEMDTFEKIAKASGLPVTFTTIQHPGEPDAWHRVLEISNQKNADGVSLRPQVASRPVGMVLGLSTYHPFTNRRTYVEELADLPVAERAICMRDPETKRRILADSDIERANSGGMQSLAKLFAYSAAALYVMPEGYDYEPTTEMTIGALAASQGKTSLEVIYDYLTEDEGQAFAMFVATNYVDGNLDVVREILTHPHTVLGLSDAGAHVNLICDASSLSTQLLLWGGKRQRGESLPIEFIVEKQTYQNAQLYGLRDRGTLEVGMRADINVIDLDALKVALPVSHGDLPAGGFRLLQEVSGYRATIKSGVITRQCDQDTGARPGRLVRGQRS